MTKNEIGNKVSTIIGELLQNGKTVPESFDADISQLLDSIEFVTLIVEIESMFDIEINDDDFQVSKLDSINKVAELINTYLERKEGGDK